MLAISTDDLSGAETIAERLGISFPILYNPDAEVVIDYGVFDVLGDTPGLATPATFIIDKNGVIRWKYVAKRYADVPSGDLVLQELWCLESIILIFVQGQFICYDLFELN